MKEEIDDVTKAALISYRLERANETLKEAKERKQEEENSTTQDSIENIEKEGE